MRINFILSSFVRSTIFEHISSYFYKYGKYRIIVTKDPIKNADVYYYFRPHLEQQLYSNSIVTVHHDLEEDDPNLSIKFFLPRYREASVVVCLNSHQQNLLKSYGIINTVVIPHGYNDEIISPLPKNFTEKKTIGFFSHYYARNVKGEDYFLSLLAKLDSNTIKIVLAGRKRKSLCEAIRSMGYECDLYEALPYYKYNDLYSLVNVLIITSKYEGGPASIPEAISTDTPIISTKVGMIYDFLDNSNVYLLTHNIDIDAVTIMDVCFNRKFYKQEKVVLLTWRDVVAQYEKVFLEIGEKPKDKNNFLISYISNFVDIYLKRLDYFYHTLYLKKRFKEKLVQIKNVYQLWLIQK